MARNYLLSLKAINLGVFAWLLTTFVLSIFNFDAVVTTADNDFVIFAFFGTIRNVFSYIIYGGGLLIAWIGAVLTTFLYPNYGNYMSELIYNYFKHYLGSWFSIGSPDLLEIPGKLLDEVAVLFNDLYLFAFQLLFLLSIIYAIRAFFKSDPKNHLRSLGSIILMMILPLIIGGLKDMLDLFHVPSTISWKQEIDQMVASNPLDMDSLSSIPIDNFFKFITSPVILFAIIAYIYLELGFQINYTDTVTKPSLERSDRLEAQLNILARESHFVTANVDKIREEAKKRIEEIESEHKEGLAIGKFFAKTGKRFSYVKEMIERRKLEEEEKKLVTAASKTRRLGRYIDRLLREDSEARDTLTASTSAPRAGNLAISTLINFTYRVVALLIISFIIIHPHWFLDTVIQLPDAITESVAMYSPEVIIVILLPIMVIFPVISRLISFIKQRNLIIRLQQEGRIKELLTSVGDYVKIQPIELEEDKPESVVSETT
ncbi:MAG: hypothetical protein ACFFG0_28480 [Candidatus Thorarchaeota archaeon]